MEKNNEEKLRLLRNLSAARVFLNLFGFYLGDVNDNINESSTITIYDRNMFGSGELSIKDNAVFLHAYYERVLLKASYTMPKNLTGKDNGVLSTWTTDIDFEVRTLFGGRIYGSVWLSSTLDSEKGIRCICQPLIKVNKSLGQDIKILMERELGLFTYVERDGDRTEEIKIAPSDDINGFIIHNVTKGNYEVLEPYRHVKHDYSRCAGIFNGAEVGEDSKKLKIYRYEEENNGIVDYCNELVPKVGDDSSTETLLQKCELMKKNDPSMYEKIKEIRKMLLVGKISLFDNLLNACYEDLSDEEISALFGLERKEMRYQGEWADNLSSSYYDPKSFATYRKHVRSINEGKK